MPASMISAPTGGRPKVIGSSIAMVASGPRPGRTPTSVPTSAPIRHSRTFHGLSATPNPSTKLLKRSIIGARLAETKQGLPAEVRRPQLERQVDAIYEQQHAERGQHHAPDERLDPARLGRRGRSRQDAEIARQDQSERTDKHREYEDRQRDEQWSAHQLSSRSPHPNDGEDGAADQQERGDDRDRGGAGGGREHVGEADQRGRQDLVAIERRAFGEPADRHDD